MPVTTPLREPTYFILAALLDGPRHGYAIAEEVEVLSQGRVRVTAGTLYGALDRLLAQGMLEVECEEVVQGRQRRYYRLTDEGRDCLASEARRMQHAAAAVTARMPSPPRLPVTAVAPS